MKSRKQVERGKEMREARFKRLLASVAGEGKLASETAKCLRDRTEYEEQRRRDLHARWHKSVYSSLCEQLERRLNPPNRFKEQVLNGHKTVAFDMEREQI